MNSLKPKSMPLSRALLASFLLALCSAAMHTGATQTPASEVEDDWGDETWEEESSKPSISHQIEAGFGGFIHPNPYVNRRQSLSELRYRWEATHYWGQTLGSVKADLTADNITNKTTATLREAVIALPIASNVDVKLGRQILTWGTGDLLFLNDMFPKDWVAFFSGRPLEYLKAPSDAVKIGVFSAFANVDIIWTPVFDSDNYLTGQRFSFYNPLTGELYGAPPELTAQDPEKSFKHGEIALRAYKTVNSQEFALYGYKGFSKQPSAFDPNRMKPIFTKQQVLGASWLSPLANGLFNLEFAWHYSLNDKDGNDPFVPNSQFRYLIGYEKEVISKVTTGIQLYMEATRNHSALIQSSLNPENEVEEYRTLSTARISYRLMQDKLRLSLFGYFSPSDKDHYWLPKANYRFNDRLSLEFGANIFGGEKPHTFFGQLEDNSNAYGRFRYSFSSN
ncbi:MAG: hypothetical protein KUG76_05630 [Gammaproteobacteria bacterium]|nr:hypothetical protein [Gammaproteobacteria bacterium]